MHGEELLVALTIGLVAAAAALVVFQTIGAGSILALLTTGVVLGPHVLGLGGDGHTLLEIAEIGVVFLLFAIGLEMEPRTLWAMRRAVFGMGGLQIVITGLLLALVFGVLGGEAWQSALLAGGGLALSSTALGMRLLEERDEIATTHGRSAFSVLLMQDLAVVPLLALVALAAGGGEGGVEPRAFLMALAMVAVVVLLGRYVLPMAFEMAAKQRNRDAFTALTALGVMTAATTMSLAGLSQAMGGFLLGMLLARSRYNHQIEAEAAPFKGWLLSIFFVAVGMSIDFASLLDRWAIVLVEVCLLIAIKIGVLLALGRLYGLSWAACTRMSCLLAQGGEFGFVLLIAGHSAGLFSDDLRAVGVLVISLSMASTPLLVRLGDWLAGRMSDAAAQAPVDIEPPHVERHVVIAGFGRVGQTVGAMLEAADAPYTAFDVDAQRVLEAQRRGRPVLYGNAGDPRLLASARVGRAALVVVTLDNPAAAERVVSAVRAFYPDVRIIARARDAETRDRMLLAGVSVAYPEVVEMSLGLGAAVLQRLGVADDVIDMAREHHRVI